MKHLLGWLFFFMLIDSSLFFLFQGDAWLILDGTPICPEWSGGCMNGGEVYMLWPSFNGLLHEAAHQSGYGEMEAYAYEFMAMICIGWIAERFINVIHDNKSSKTMQ